MQFLVIGSVGGSRDNNCIAKKDLEITSVFIRFHFQESAVYGIIPFVAYFQSKRRGFE